MVLRRLLVCVGILLLVGGTVPVPAQAATLDELQTTLSQLQLVLQNLLGHPLPQVKGASTIVVTNDAELVAAIKGVTGGETIQLAPGTYSNIQIVGGTYNQLIVGASKTAKGVPTLTAPVTITSQDPAHPAVIPSIAIRATNHWHLKGLAIRPVKAQLPIAAAIYMIEGVDNTFEDSTLTYGDATGWTAADWLAKAGDGVILGGDSNVVRNNTIKNVYMGISMYNTATHALIKNNTLDGIGGDGLRVLADYATVDSNFIKNFKKINDNHEDCSQSWGTASGTVSQDAFVRGVTFQNNICINNTDPNASVNDPLYHPGLQGFDDFDGGTEGWLVQNNVFAGTAYHGIAYYGATNMTIRNNTILDSDSVINGVNNVWIAVFPNKTGSIQATGNTFQNNLATKYAGYGTSSTVVNSQLVKMADYDTYFRDWRHGDMRLLVTAPVQGVGANLDPATVGSNVTLTTVTTPAPIVTLTTSVAALTTGAAATLTWTSTNATTCTASGEWSGTQSTAGSVSTGVITTAGTKTYTLTCTGAGGSSSQTVTVTAILPVVTTPVPTVTFSSSASTLTTGGSATLTWSSTDATACMASGAWTGTKTVSGSESTGIMSTAGIKTYTLMCTGGTSTVMKNVSINVSDPVVVPPIASSSFTIGDRVSVTKQVNVRTTGLLSTTTLIGTNPAGSQGVLVAGPAVTNDRYGVITWFNVNFDTGFDGWVGADNFAPALPSTPTTTPTLSFSASPASVLVGTTGSTLTWSSTHVTACTAGGAWSGAKATSGSWSTGLLGTVGTTTYTLACNGINGSVVTKKVTVRAVNAPTIASATTSMNVVTNANVNVRVTPNGTKLGSQPAGAKGTLGTQPSVVTGGHTWVYVNFDSGVDGWIARRYLTTLQPLVSASTTSGLTETELQTKISQLLMQLATLQQLLVQLKGQ